MGQSVLAKEKYYFDASGRTITFCNVDFVIGKVKQITNITSGDIIYCPQMNILGTVSDSILTLNYNTTSMSDTDELQILYDWEANYHKCWDNSFSMNTTSGVDTRLMSVIGQIGSGQTVSQNNGNLVFTTGTTANAETIVRSNIPFSREILTNIANLRSQAIVNNYLSIQLIDIIGEVLDITVNSTTSATVTIPVTNINYKSFEEILSQNISGMVGMKMFMGNLGGVTGAIPGQYAIASSTYSAGNPITLTFTVSGWVSGQSGTVYLYGWNWIHMYHNSATATNAYIDCGRNGRASNLGDVAATITTSTTGSIFSIHKTSQQVLFSDGALTSGANLNTRGTRTQAVPAEETRLYLQLVARNGSTSPASTTTWTVPFARIEETNAVPTQISGVKYPSGTASLFTFPVSIIGTATTSGAITSIGLSTSSGGVTTRHTNISAATTNATLVKSSAGTLNGGSVKNTSDMVVYFKLFNMSTAPTVGTSSPVYNIPIYPQEKIDINSLTGTVGDRFSSGISYAVTAGSSATDAKALPVAGMVHINLNYA